MKIHEIIDIIDIEHFDKEKYTEIKKKKVLLSSQDKKA